MSLDYHPARGPVDLGDLVLSSALDWTVKLWKTRAPSSTSVAPTSTSSSMASNHNTTSSAPGGVGNPEQAIAPLLEFAREDVVYDARWSPHKPGVFALVDGAGSLEIWDLNLDIEVPVVKTTPETNNIASRGGGYAAKSLDKVMWEEKEGRKVAVGGASGVVSVFEVGADLCAAEGGVRGEEWSAMKRAVGRWGGRG